MLHVLHVLRCLAHGVAQYYLKLCDSSIARDPRDLKPCDIIGFVSLFIIHKHLSARLSLTAQSMEIEQNGLGFNNLIFMAVVLSELAKNPDAAYRSLIVEEPEAHLHPQFQRVLLSYLSGIPTKEGEKPVQLFVTSHSPNFASNSKLEPLLCLVENEVGVETFFPRDVQFAKGKREKLERYLDVTRDELFFARRVIFVEGAAELMLVDALAMILGFDLREYGVSLISVEGLNFDSFLPLFGEKGLRIPVSVITDADPFEEEVVPELAEGSYLPRRFRRSY